MKKIWIAYLTGTILNFFLAVMDYFSGSVPFEIWSVLPAVMLILNIALATTIIYKASDRKKVIFPVVILLLVSHYHIVGMVFATIVWKINGFAP